MNYQLIYTNLIEKARNRGLNKKSLNYQTEKHHIIPKCLNGTNDLVNLVLLTPKEHYVAHHLLSKIYPNHVGCFMAYRMMCIMDSADTHRGKFKISASEFQKMREHYSKFRKNFKYSEESKQKMRKKRKNTDNMRKPKTRTEALIREQQRRIDMGFFKGKNNPMYGSTFTWYNDGIRNYRIKENDDITGLIKGKIEKRHKQKTCNNTSTALLLRMICIL